MNRIRSFLAGLAFGIAGLGVAFALPITGPLDLAGLRTDLNAQVMKWMSYPDAELGELQLLGANSFAANGTIATAMSSLGPVGSHTTVQRWMIVVNPSGTIGYVPVF